MITYNTNNMEMTFKSIKTNDQSDTLLNTI